MKLSKKPTEWLLIAVSGTDGINEINYVLVEMSEYYRQCLRQRVDMAKAASHMDNFYGLAAWDVPHGWYVFGKEGLKKQLYGRNIFWSFVEFDIEQEGGALQLANVEMEAGYMSVFGDGSAQFCATPKFQSVELYTDEFQLKEILDVMDQELGTA